MPGDVSASRYSGADIDAPSSTISSCPAATRFLCRLAIGIIGGRDLGESGAASSALQKPACQPGTPLPRPFVGQTASRAYRRLLKSSFILTISARDFSIVWSVTAISAVSTRGASSGLGTTSRRRQFLKIRRRGLRDNLAMELDPRSSPAIPTPGKYVAFSI